MEIQCGLIIEFPSLVKKDETCNLEKLGVGIWIDEEYVDALLTGRISRDDPWPWTHVGEGSCGLSIRGRSGRRCKEGGKTELDLVSSRSFFRGRIPMMISFSI